MTITESARLTYAGGAIGGAIAQAFAGEGAKAFLLDGRADRALREGSSREEVHSNNRNKRGEKWTIQQTRRELNGPLPKRNCS